MENRGAQCNCKSIVVARITKEPHAACTLRHADRSLHLVCSLAGGRFVMDQGSKVPEVDILSPEQGALYPVKGTQTHAPNNSSPENVSRHCRNKLLSPAS